MAAQQELIVGSRRDQYMRAKSDREAAEQEAFKWQPISPKVTTSRLIQSHLNGVKPDQFYTAAVAEALPQSDPFKPREYRIKTFVSPGS